MRAADFVISFYWAGRLIMRHIALLATGVIFIATSNPVSATPLSPSGLRGHDQSAIVLVQAQPKKEETIKQKVKRVWRDLTGYKFVASCPAILTVSRTNCTETGKSREEARAKCQSRNPFCAVGDAK
jgi:hypothetical protein